MPDETIDVNGGEPLPAPVVAFGDDAGDENDAPPAALSVSSPSSDDAGTEPLPPPPNALIAIDSLQAALAEAVNVIRQDGRDFGAELTAETAQLTARLVEVAGWPASAAKLEKLEEIKQQYALIVTSGTLRLAFAQKNAAQSVVNIAIRFASNGLLAVLA